MDTLAVILWVQRLGEQGVVTLIGKCGRTIKVHISHCARCSLPNIDPTINPSLRPFNRRMACERCKGTGRAAQMLLCDGCGDAWHHQCLPRPLSGIPPADAVWVCPGAATAA